MPSPEKRSSDQPCPASVKRLRKNEQTNNAHSNSSQEALPQATKRVESFSGCGILEWVTVKNFMCHDHLSFEFSPNINFIQGRNGSGKSAILTAVIIGLGGTTRCTNRGSSLKDLVKHGKGTAIIEIGIRNSGRHRPFKPELYGRTIIVERKISTTAAGSYCMKGWKGTVVSNKKDELIRMLEHFNFQVDNPITLLNQDMARSFFNTTEPKTLFKLFLKATQLQQMKDDYAHIKQSIDACMRIVESRMQSLPELEKEVEEQRFRYQFSLTLKEKGKKLKELRQELTLAKIMHCEREKEKAEKALKNNETSRKKITQEIETLNNGFADAEATREINAKLLQEVNKKLSEIGKRVREKNSEMKNARNNYKEKDAQLSIAEKSARVINKEIATLKAAVKQDHDKCQSEWAAERAVWQNKISEVEAKMKELLETVQTENTHWQNLQHTVDVKTSSLEELNLEEKALHRQMSGFERELKGLQSQRGSPLTVYGQWVPQLLRKIDAAHSKGMFKKKPVGPLGSFVKVKDTAWAHVAERIFGKRITSFCVDNKADESVLKKLMGEINFNNQYKPSVTVSKFRDKVLDVSRFAVVSPDYQSLWSILSVSDTVVANTLIDLMQVESILLIPSAQDAGKLLKDRATVPKNCKCAYTLNLDQYYPDPNFRVYSGKGPNRAKFLQVSVDDKISEINRSKEECQEKLRTLSQEKQSLMKEKAKIESEMNSSQKKTQMSRKQYNTLRIQLTDLQNQEPSPPPDVARLEEDIIQMETKLQNSKGQMDLILQSKSQCKNMLKVMEQALSVLKKEESELYKDAEKYKNNMEQSTVFSAKSKISKLKKRDQELKQQVNSLQEALVESSKTLKDAQEIGEKLNVQETKRPTKSVAELQQMYTSLENRLNKERETSGNPVTIVEKYKQTKQRYKQISEDINKHVNLIKKMKESLQMRDEKNIRFHKWLAVLVRYFFKENLSMRKLQGSISINFNEQSLDIHVEKPGTNTNHSSGNDWNIATPSKKRKKLAHEKLVMMSGGERSFATVAFIIALWNAVASPVRILDEFDVFMDVIARNRAMNMIINGAKNDTQYIFLTPLSLDTQKLQKCAIFRMPDPDREEENKT